MRETSFIEQNKKKWDEFEQMLKEENKDPDKMSELFVQITDDLSYAKTFYPNRSVKVYLNNLSQQVFYGISGGRRNNLKNFKKFWLTDLPRVVYESRKELMLSLVIFIASIAIGIFSSIQNPDFPQTILGESYMKMTEENIESGDPMAVYKKSGEIDMFLYITVNNLYVAFRTFIFGVFFSIGTILSLLFNGIMLGTFQYFFYQKGLFIQSFLSIWLHGTLEISSIVIAGGAGIKMGSGLIFPRSYSRMQAFKISARKGLNIMLGIAPIFVFAAIIESFVTRYTETHWIIKLSLIIISLIFIVGYFVILPLSKAKRGEFDTPNEEKLPASPPFKVDVSVISSTGEVFANIFGVYKKYFWKILSGIIVGSVAYAMAASWLLKPESLTESFFIMNLFDYDRENGKLLLAMNSLTLAVNIFAIYWLFLKEINYKKTFQNYLIQNFYKTIIISCFINSLFFLHGFLTFVLLVFGLPILLLWYFISITEDVSIFQAIGRTFYLSGNSYGRLLGLGIIISFFSLLFLFLIASPFVSTYIEAINWSIHLDESGRKTLYVILLTLICFVSVNTIIPLFCFAYALSYYTIKEIKEATMLKERIRNFGVRTKNGYQK